MCGIVAATGPFAAEQVARMRPLIEHRGLPGRVTIKNTAGHGFIAHARLPISGPGPENDQPILTDKWAFAFVGEILDYKERCPSAKCDLTVALDAWTSQGPRGFTKFDGFWGMVAIELSSGDMHLLADYLGQKPLYYTRTVLGTWLVSNEIAPLVTSESHLDELYLADVAKWGYCPDPRRTPYKEICRVRPGEHVILYQDNRRYARRITDPLLSRWGPHDELKREIEAAVKRRVLSSDVPVAALVSGGLDSAITIMLARRHKDLHIYHVDNNEREEFDRLGIPPADVTFLDVNAGVAPGLNKALFYMQEPIDLGSLLPQIALSDAIGRAGGERVCLTGDGADEFFGGYGRASRYDSQASDVWRELVCWHLPRLDRVMMRNRIEVRSPFLARRVAELALGLPYPLRRDKKILRELFKDDLPKGVANVPKKALRTSDVERNREGHTLQMIDLLRRQTG